MSFVHDELTLQLARHRYRALDVLRAAHDGADWFTIRMMGRKALVVRGEEGVRTFYDPALVTRSGAVPAPLRLLLFGPGAVHGLNGEEHQRRKGVHLGIMTREAAMGLAREVAVDLEKAADGWPGRGSVELFDQLVEIYGSAVLHWAGTGTIGAEARSISRDLARMVDGFGLGGTTYPRAYLARARTQRWARRVIKDVRAGSWSPPFGSAVAALAQTPREELSDTVAATELLNIVRPTVAVAYFGAYAAQALLRQQDWRAPLAEGSEQHLRAFELEVRRYYPFVPLLTGRLQSPYEQNGETLRTRDWMVLDVIGTNRDPELWERPDDFMPERFLDRDPTAFDYVPQGGGDPTAGHRCPGEPLAQGVLTATIRQLAALEYDLSEEARAVPLQRVPSLPCDRVTLQGVRLR